MHSTQQAAVSEATVGQSTSFDKPTSMDSNYNNNKTATLTMPFLLPGVDESNSPGINELLLQLSQNSDIMKLIADRQSTTPTLTLETFVLNNIYKLPTALEQSTIHNLLYKLLNQYKFLKQFSTVFLGL